MNRFTSRSSSEWNDTTTSRPPAPAAPPLRAARARSRPVRRSPGCAAPGSCASPGRCRSGPAAPRARMMAASRAVVVIGASARAATMARAMRRDSRSSPKPEQRVGQLLLGQRVHQIGRGRPVGAPCACRAARRRGSEKPRAGIVDLERRHAEVEHHAVEPVTTPRARSSDSMSPNRPCDQVQPAGMAGGQRGAARDRRRDRGRSPRACRRRAPGWRRRSRRRRTCRRDRGRPRAARASRSTSGSITGTCAPVSCSRAALMPSRSPAGSGRARARARAPRAAAPLGGRRLPDLERAAESHEDHALGQAGMRASECSGSTIRPSLSASTG